MKKPQTGRPATKLDQLAYAHHFQISADEKVVIHHIFDSPSKAQLEIERRSPRGITFERIVIT